MKHIAFRLFVGLFLGLWASSSAAAVGISSPVAVSNCQGGSQPEEPNPPETRRCGGGDSEDQPEPPSN